MKYSSKTASGNRSVQDLSNNHVLTHNFGNMDVVRMQYLVPGDKMKFDVAAFTRLLPLPCPTFSNLKMVLRAFCVPLDFVMKGFSDYLSDNPDFSGGTGRSMSVPYTRPLDILSTFLDLGLVEVSASSRPDFFILQDIDGTGIDLTLTSIGRRVRSLLLQLGYKLPHLYVADGVSSSSNVVAAQNEKLSLLPLLSFLKFYLDWVVPARFVNSNFGSVKAYLDRPYYGERFVDPDDTIYDDYNVVTGAISSDSPLDVLLRPLPAVSFLFDDYYTSAFKTAYGPENSSFVGSSGLGIVGSGSNSSLISNPSIESQFDNEPFVNSTISTTQQRYITQLQLLSLGRLQDMVNRKKITDEHVLDWLRLTYGVSPSKDSLHWSTYLGSSSSVIQIGDIMATATTDSSQGVTVVGQYAGKGLAGTSSSWKIEVDKHSLFFITCELQNKTSYVQGLDPFMKCLNRADFWLPEFDNVGVRAIAHRELVFDTFDNDAGDGTEHLAEIPSPSAVFGFAPRYSEFKHVNDMVSGDFCNTGVNVGLDSWYLSRKYGILDNPVISLDFCSASNKSVGSQYDRIFQNTDDVDHFYSVFNIGCRADRPMQSITDYFDEIETDGGKNVDIDNNNGLS